MFFFALLTLLHFPAPGFSQATISNEYQVKAAFLFNFAKFVAWPASAFSDPKQPLSICVYGHDPFGGLLEDALFNKSIGDRRFVVGRANQIQDLVGCQIVFVGGNESARIPELLSRLHRHAILLVGESEGFAASGGTIQFTIDDNRVHFIINPDAADRSGLKINSKLLALAKIVRDANPSVGANVQR